MSNKPCDYGYSIGVSAGVNDEFTFVIAFNYVPFSPAITNCHPDNSSPAEGDVVEDMIVFFEENAKEKKYHEVPEILYGPLGLPDVDGLEDMCRQHAMNASEPDPDEDDEHELDDDEHDQDEMDNHDPE